MISRNISLVFLLFSFMICKGQSDETCNFLENISLGNITAERYNEIFMSGKNSIPCLIDLIDTDNKELIVGFQDPLSSVINPFMTNYVGMKYAYLIEFILSQDRIEVVKGNNWKEMISPYCIYKYGIIVTKNENNRPVLKPLTYKDMKLIKKMYRNWWEENKGKSIEVLRKEWKTNGPVLSGNYIWI
ncbi:hypothetical protein [Bacteroides sp.]